MLPPGLGRAAERRADPEPERRGRCGTVATWLLYHALACPLRLGMAACCNKVGTCLCFRLQPQHYAVHATFAASRCTPFATSLPTPCCLLVLLALQPGPGGAPGAHAGRAFPQDHRQALHLLAAAHRCEGAAALQAGGRGLGGGLAGLEIHGRKLCKQNVPPATALSRTCTCSTNPKPFPAPPHACPADEQVADKKRKAATATEQEKQPAANGSAEKK